MLHRLSLPSPLCYTTAPEKAQAFGTRAHQFMGDLVFQKEVTVVWDKDRCGRLVGEVLGPVSEDNV
jgi:endonuclease YncB( thermonuclease family)